MSLYTFGVPLYCEPSSYFRKFIKDLGDPVSHPCEITYWRKRITLTSSSLDENGRKASVYPFPPDFPSLRAKKLEQLISLFASKFNASMSLALNSTLEVKLELISHISPIKREQYGDDLHCILQVTVCCNSVAAEMALNNFFTVIDCPKVLD